MADQMPRRIKTCELGALCLPLLHAILSKMSYSQIEDGANGGGWKRLGNGNERHFIRISPGSRGSCGDSRADSFKVRCDRVQFRRHFVRILARASWPIWPGNSGILNV